LPLAATNWTATAIASSFTSGTGVPRRAVAGQWIRRRGEVVQHGAVVLQPGTRLTPQALGLAASVGAAALTVWRRPRVALFSTGDELVMPGEPLKPGAIYNSNRFTLRGLLQAAGCEVRDLGIVPDRLDATRAALRQAAAVVGEGLGKVAQPLRIAMTGTAVSPSIDHTVYLVGKSRALARIEDCLAAHV